MNFEWKKWIKNPKNIILIGLSILSVFVSLTNLYYKNLEEDQAVFNHLKALNDEIDPPQGYSGPKGNYKLSLLLDENGKLPSNKEQALQKILIDIIYLLEDEHTAQVEKKWLEKTKIQMERLTLQQKYLDLGGEPWLNETNIAEQLARDQWLLERDIPIANVEIGQQGFYFVYYLLSHWMNFIIVTMIGLCFFDFLTSEYERKNYLFMAIQPINTKRFFQRKYVIAVSIFVGGLIMLLALGFIVASLVHGTGSLMYPIAIYQGTAFRLIPLWNFLIKTISLQVLFIMCAISFLLLLSKWVKNAVEVLGVFLIIMFVPVILEKLIPKIHAISFALPFFYMDTNAKIVEISSHFSTSYVIQVLVLISWNLVLALIWQLNWREKKG
ncbi:hypothetical protein A5881_003153 [Enterococcus termitis]|nr:hypothetical protein A5881_003696 [Enterococcus termitis]